MLELSQSLQVEKVGIGEWWKPFQGHAGARSVHFELQEATVWDFPDGPVASLCTINAGDPCLVPGRGTRSHMPQLEILQAATKTRFSQVNK